jgi:hypothetical protein
VEPGNASCSGDQQKQALQSAAGDDETVSGPTIRGEDDRRETQYQEVMLSVWKESWQKDVCLYFKNIL